MLNPDIDPRDKPAMQGKLFSQDFLWEGIKETPAWKQIDAAAWQRLRQRLNGIFAPFAAAGQVNEAVTEAEIIYPVLQALGWEHYLPQQTASGKGRQDVPDILLFADAAGKQTALAERKDDSRYRHGIAIVESKRWQRPLDRGDQSDLLDAATPSNQMLRYLSRVEVASERAIQWGILTNGQRWRLYFQGARSRAEEFLEIDLALLAGLSGLQPELFSLESQDTTHGLQVFYLLFGRNGFMPQPDDAAGRSFQQIALAESRYWEERVSQDLGERIFTQLFPQLAAALAWRDPTQSASLAADDLETVRREALILLYRLLFLLYAEDRQLLPVYDRRYDDYSLRKIRLELADRIDAADVFSAGANRYYNHLKDLFRIINYGDAALGVPPYNGGLFDDQDHPLLQQANLPDALLAPLIDGLSRRAAGAKRQWINYRDLSVQHLGSIYERLLEYSVVVDAAGQIGIRPAVFVRRNSGSYYTHDSLVQLLIGQTVGPLLQEFAHTFQAKAAELARSRAPLPQRLQALQALDPAAQMLNLKICDPAMGSGHFLVSLVDYLADQILEHIADSAVQVDWAPADNPYVSPLTLRIAAIRERLLASCRDNGWTVDPAHLDDRHIVRRMILKRVIHGVDKNPMAVELAKVALWLHTFTVGAPLSFLDHNLRTGDALYGERVQRMLDEFRRFGAIFQQHELTRIAVATQSMNQLADLTDVDIAEVHLSRRLFEQIDATLAPLSRLLDFWHALRWLTPARASQDSVVQRGLAELLSGRFGDLLDVINAGTVNVNDAAAQAVQSLLERTRRLTEEEHFLHWEIAFPTVWRRLESGYPQGGFDAIIGNPPWDRLKLQEVEWFAARQPDIAQAARATDRKRLIAQLEKSGDRLWTDYQQARQQAETAARIARENGEYPLLSGGDVNLYSLFVERAQSLIKSNGIVGLLTPSGIASDKGASEFFKSIATEGRLGALLDFENKKVFFPDVHASFKFCALIFGGPQRLFPVARCAFFLHAVDELADPERSFTLSAADFAAVNPNTGTAPIFRRHRDAELTKAIYSRCPVLVDRRADPPKQVWPVRYTTMFHMTNDSHLFKRRDELEADGFYPIGANVWRKGGETYVPLYEGKMAQAYDHRAAGIVVNPDNLHRPAQPEPASLAQHQDMNWLPTPQFWVDQQTLKNISKLEWTLTFKDVTAPTNMRTMIATIMLSYGFGNTLPVLLPMANQEQEYRCFAPLLLANLNSFVFDFIARQKVQGQHLNLYIVEQIPVIPAEQFQKLIGNHPIADFIRDQVLHLVYTAVDMQPFAEDMGYAGGPFVWDEDDRRHRLARLDALFFHLYGLDRNDAAYILEQFPIVREQDERQFGRYLTRDLILAYMNAVAAGDLNIRVA